MPYKLTCVEVKIYDSSIFSKRAKEKENELKLTHRITVHFGKW